MRSFISEPLHEKANNLCFRPDMTQIALYSHRSRLEACNFRFKKKRYCTIRVAKTKALISCAFTVQLICVFVFAFSDCWVSGATAQVTRITRTIMNILRPFKNAQSHTLKCLHVL